MCKFLDGRKAESVDIFLFLHIFSDFMKNKYFSMLKSRFLADLNHNSELGWRPKVILRYMLYL